jgi:hypothetical protein
MRVAISPLPNTPSWRGAQLKNMDNFTFLPYEMRSAYQYCTHNVIRND